MIGIKFNGEREVYWIKSLKNITLHIVRMYFTKQGLLVIVTDTEFKVENSRLEMTVNFVELE